ncbi:MAG: hypothetical protein K2K29_04790, partial [Muribaculaceae bacterium]|nr:hypothetical protein [Muribaculaceae bacterium]
PILSISDITESEDGIISFYAEVDNSGIKDITGNEAAKSLVKSINGDIHNVSRGNISIFNLNGAKIATLHPAQSIPLPSALYIISSADSAVKFLHR